MKSLLKHFMKVSFCLPLKEPSISNKFLISLANDSISQKGGNAVKETVNFCSLTQTAKLEGKKWN